MVLKGICLLCVRWVGYLRVENGGPLQGVLSVMKFGDRFMYMLLTKECNDDRIQVP